MEYIRWNILTNTFQIRAQGFSQRASVQSNWGAGTKSYHKIFSCSQYPPQISRFVAECIYMHIYMQLANFSEHLSKGNICKVSAIKKRAASILSFKSWLHSNNSGVNICFGLSSVLLSWKVMVNPLLSNCLCFLLLLTFEREKKDAASIFHFTFCNTFYHLFYNRQND